MRGEEEGEPGLFDRRTSRRVDVCWLAGPLYPLTQFTLAYTSRKSRNPSILTGHLRTGGREEVHLGIPQECSPDPSIRCAWRVTGGDYCSSGEGGRYLNSTDSDMINTSSSLLTFFSFPFLTTTHSSSFQLRTRVLFSPKPLVGRLLLTSLSFSLHFNTSLIQQCFF